MACEESLGKQNTTLGKQTITRRSILEETSIESLEKVLLGFLTKYEDICSTFVNYFKNTYVSRLVKCAMCYRQFDHAKTDTNMFVESFHNKLKTFYLERMPNKGRHNKCLTGK